MGIGIVVTGLGVAGLASAADDVAETSTTTVPPPATAPPETSTTTPAPASTTTPAPASTTTTLPREDPAGFVADLAAALAAGDTAYLEARLHPAVVSLYGADACRATLSGASAPDRELTVAAVGEPGRWEWVIDGRTTPVDDAVAVTLADGSEIHVAYVGTELRWFTDCGEPLP